MSAVGQENHQEENAWKNDIGNFDYLCVGNPSCGIRSAGIAADRAVRVANLDIPAFSGSIDPADKKEERLKPDFCHIKMP